MHILMIAPEPFFEPRGTPFSEYHRIRALIDLGHTVDLVTYPFGGDVAMAGLRIFRCARPPWLRSVRVGPSWPKLLLDCLLAWSALRLALAARYEVVHSHEEGSAIGVLIAQWRKIPHLYDMHSSLPQQLENFGFSRSTVLRWALTRLERAVIRRSRAIIVICPQLVELVRQVDPTAAAVLIENAPGAGDSVRPGDGKRVREQLGLAPATPVVLYAGTFEVYQGLPLLLAAAQVVRTHVPAVRFVLAGGKPAQIEELRRQARAAGVDDLVVFAGEQPAAEVPAFLDAADVLVSPRSAGTNTPLKIYQYLRAGRPIVATRLLTHTQVLNDEVAVLTEPTPEAFGHGIVEVLTDRARARAMALAAERLAATNYSYEAYLERTRTAYSLVATPREASTASARQR